MNKLVTSPRKPPQMLSDPRPPKQNARPSPPPEFARTSFEARVQTSQLSTQHGWPDTVQIEVDIHKASGVRTTSTLWLTPDEADALAAAVDQYRKTGMPQMRRITAKNL